MLGICVPHLHWIMENFLVTSRRISGLFNTEGTSSPFEPVLTQHFNADAQPRCLNLTGCPSLLALPHFIPISPQLLWKSSDQCKTQSASPLQQSPWAYSACICTRSHCNLRHVIVGFRCSHSSKREGSDFGKNLMWQECFEFLPGVYCIWDSVPFQRFLHTWN